MSMILRQCSLVNTDPHGFEGLFISMHLVRLSICFLIESKSISQSLFGYQIVLRDNKKLLVNRNCETLHLNSGPQPCIKWSQVAEPGSCHLCHRGQWSHTGFLGNLHSLRWLRSRWKDDQHSKTWLHVIVYNLLLDYCSSSFQTSWPHCVSIVVAFLNYIQHGLLHNGGNVVPVIFSGFTYSPDKCQEEYQVQG